MQLIVVPIKIHLVKDPSGLYTSRRDDKNVSKLLADANRIWAQANVSFRVDEIVQTALGSSAIPNALGGNFEELRQHENLDRERVNVFLARRLLHPQGSMNGIALRALDSMLVADDTTVNDFRTTAHELGHLLGLVHVEPPDRLMARGKNGEALSEAEVLIGRENANARDIRSSSEGV